MNNDINNTSANSRSNRNRQNKPRRRPRSDNYKPPFNADVLSQSTEILRLRENTKTLLDGAGITTINDVVKKEEKDFYKISKFNKKNLMDLLNGLKVNKLYLKPTEIQKSDTKIADNNNTAEKNNSVNKDNISERKSRIRKGRRDEISKFPKAAAEYVEVTKVKHYSLPESETAAETPDIYVKVNRNGKWGFKDRDGKQVVAPIYDEVFNFKEEFCCVQKEDLFGFINREGEEIIALEYTCASSFSEGLACVYKGDKCGYINTANEVIIDFKFDAGTPVVDGECRVKKDGKWGELHISTPDADKNLNIGIENIRWIV